MHSIGPFTRANGEGVYTQGLLVCPFPSKERFGLLLKRSFGSTCVGYCHFCCATQTAGPLGCKLSVVTMLAISNTWNRSVKGHFVKKAHAGIRYDVA